MIILHMHTMDTTHKAHLIRHVLDNMWRQVHISQGRTFSPFAYRVAVAVPGTPLPTPMLLIAHANLYGYSRLPRPFSCRMVWSHFLLNLTYRGMPFYVR